MVAILSRGDDLIVGEVRKPVSEASGSRRRIQLFLDCVSFVLYNDPHTPCHVHIWDRSGSQQTKSRAQTS